MRTDTFFSFADDSVVMSRLTDNNTDHNPGPPVLLSKVYRLNADRSFINMFYSCLVDFLSFFRFYVLVLNFWISCLPQGGIKIFLFIFLLIFKTKLHRTMCNDCAVTEALIASTKHNVWKEVDFRNFRVRILPTRLWENLLLRAKQHTSVWANAVSIS